MAMKMRLKMKNRSHRYDINRTSPRHGNRYTIYRMCPSVMMVVCINPYFTFLLSDITTKLIKF